MKPEGHPLIAGPDWDLDVAKLRNRSGLQQVLDGIAADPFDRVARFQYPASGIVADYSADGPAVAYFVLPTGAVVLLTVDESDTG